MHGISIILNLFIKANDEIEAENQQATAGKDFENFTLYFSKAYRRHFILRILLLLVFVPAVLLVHNEDDSIRIIAGVLWLAAIVYYIHCFRWKLSYDTYTIEYTPGFGAKQSYRYSDILHVRQAYGSLVLDMDNTRIRLNEKIIGRNLLIQKLHSEHFEIL